MTPSTEQSRLTDHQARYLAYLLTRRMPVDSGERLTRAVASAQVDLNPHQVDAALFAVRSPLSQGVLLADEVGLGKTIEAGLVLSQRWAEGRRHLLVIAPSNLRKQWMLELTEKFFLPCAIHETRSWNAMLKDGMNPVGSSTVLICSYEFAKSKADELQRVPWDLVVFDEAHRLRNVWKPGNVTAKALQQAFSGVSKLLLTATPLQNSLQELYGLVSVLDPHVFGDLASFKEQFSGKLSGAGFDALKNRIRPICHRTLRRQVQAYVKYTRRISMLEEFTPAASEQQLYRLVTDYLSRPNLAALPNSQRTLITLVLQRQLASSSFAIAGSLAKMAKRLRDHLAAVPEEPLEEGVVDDFDGFDAVADEWDGSPQPEQLAKEEREALTREAAELEQLAELAVSIQENAKGQALLKALNEAFRTAHGMGAPEKAIVFTESRRTQEYLLRLLSNNGHAEGIVLFNGSNNDQRSKAIYEDWLKRHVGSDRVTGSKTADMRTALVDWFREKGRIMIATEAGAEGINLQFCSLVVNFDLPWNPQRIEQRIGRCHRYGQKYDVVVVNFLDRTNAADQRVYELLALKFQLFEGVFGVSDEVLGSIESGVDFERRIAAIYRDCRLPEEIDSAFNVLQTEMQLEIRTEMQRTRQSLMEHFDDEVREKLRVRGEETQAQLNRHEQLLMMLARHELTGHADFLDEGAFTLRSVPWDELNDDVVPGLYELPRRSRDAHLFRINHPLAEALLRCAKERTLLPGQLVLRYGDHDGRVTALERLVGRAGSMEVIRYTVTSAGLPEDHLLVAAVCDDGTVLPTDAAERLLLLPGSFEASGASVTTGTTTDHLARLRQEVDGRVADRNLKFLGDESEKLDGWAEDLKVSLQAEVADLTRQIAEAKGRRRKAVTLEEKLAGEKEVKALETSRKRRRQMLYDEEDRIDAKRDELIREVEERLRRQAEEQPVLSVRWRVQ